MPPNVLIVGIDGASPALLSLVLRQAAAPHLQTLLRQGCHGPLHEPLGDVSVAHWASLLSGQPADVHQILHSDLPWCNHTRPVSLAESPVPMLWDYLDQASQGCDLIGVPATHRLPADTFPGRVIGADFPGSALPEGNWSTPDATRFIGIDAQDVDYLTGLRLHPREVDAALLGTLIPELADIDQDADRRPAMVAVALARSVSIHRAATALLSEDSHSHAHITVVAYPLLQDLGAHFSACLSPQEGLIPPQDKRLYRQVLPGGVALLDTFIGALLERMDTHSTVILVSGHGFDPGQVDAGTQTAQHAPLLHHITPRSTLGYLIIHGPKAPKSDISAGEFSSEGILTLLLEQAGITPPAKASLATQLPAGDEIHDDITQQLAFLKTMGYPDPLHDTLRAQQTSSTLYAKRNLCRLWHHRGEHDRIRKLVNALSPREQQQLRTMNHTNTRVGTPFPPI